MSKKFWACQYKEIDLCNYNGKNIGQKFYSYRLIECGSKGTSTE